MLQAADKGTARRIHDCFMDILCDSGVLCIISGRTPCMFCSAGVQHSCLCLRQGLETATTAGDALHVEPDPQARAAAAARIEAGKPARVREAMLVPGAAQLGAQREPWAVPAVPARSAARPGTALVWGLADCGRSVSGAAAAPFANAGRTGVPACGQRGARAREAGPVFTFSGGPGRTATPAPPPRCARAGAMWPRAEARGTPGAARTGSKAERPSAGAAPAAAGGI